MSVLYFAYGSNLLFARLHARCPSIVSAGVARLDGHRLHFDKPGGDASGKCGIEATGGDSHVLGVLYRMRRGEKPVLDRIEGVGHGYDDRPVVVQADGGPVECFTYYPTRHESGRPPWDWYKAFVLEGARENRFPESYVAMIEAVESRVDPDHRRRVENLAILSRGTPAGAGP